jgi:hypothetical protein
VRLLRQGPAIPPGVCRIRLGNIDTKNPLGSTNQVRNLAFLTGTLHLTAVSGRSHMANLAILSGGDVEPNLRTVWKFPCLPDQIGFESNSLQGIA